MVRLRRLGALAFLAAISTQVPGAPAQAQDTIRIGVPMELSGQFVAYGASGRRGAEFAAEVYGGTVAARRSSFWCAT